MTHDESADGHLPPEGGSHELRPEEGIALKPLLITLWGRRRMLAGTVAAAMLLFAVAAAGLYALSPRERVAGIQFRTLFEGTDRGRYPNGTAFSSADVIASPVLTDVFANNELERYGSFDDFRSALFIVESNPAIDLLAHEYQAKLADTKLTPVDRGRIEEEFRKKRESLPVGYSLNFRRTERMKQMPQDLMSKVLHDTLATWAQHAAQRKGVLKYDIAVLSKNIVPVELLETGDYVVVVDILRSKILRTLANIDQIAQLPGANVARTGDNQVSLPEIRANLEDVYRFKVQPLVGLIRSTALSQDPKLAILYLENQLFQNRIEHTEASGRVRTLQESLQQYMQKERQVAAAAQQPGNQGGSQSGAMPSVIPQFGESFLDRLADLSNQNNDVRFRQDITERVIAEGIKAVALEKDTTYYEDLIASMKGALGSGAGVLPVARERAAELVKARAAEAVGDLVRALDQVNAIYAALSTDNLNPDTALYAITAPFTVRTTSAMNMRAMAVAGFMVFLLSAIAGALACLGYGYFRREIIGPAPPVQHEPALPVQDSGSRSAGTLVG